MLFFVYSIFSLAIFSTSVLPTSLEPTEQIYLWNSSGLLWETRFKCFLLFTNGSFLKADGEKWWFCVLLYFILCVGHKMQFNTKNVLISVTKVEQWEKHENSLPNSINKQLNFFTPSCIKTLRTVLTHSIFIAKWQTFSRLRQFSGTSFLRKEKKEIKCLKSVKLIVRSVYFPKLFSQHLETSSSRYFAESDTNFLNISSKCVDFNNILTSSTVKYNKIFL